VNDEPKPLVEVRGVSKRFPGVQALASVSLDIRPGEVHAIAGENGAGKSTLMKLLSQVEKPSEGTILVAARRSGSVIRGMRSGQGSALGQTAASARCCP
jgi:ABC-type sugar transport system ATPase subunit